MAGIGNSIVTETKEKNFKDFSKFTLIICWIAGFCSVCMLCIYQPFMELWVGKDLMFSFSAVVCFVTYFFVRQLNSLYSIYKDAAGMWHEDRFRPLAAALTNLALNLILVQFIGVYGILISTVVAILAVGMPWIIHNLFTVIFDRKYMLNYLKKTSYFVLIVVLSCVVTYVICSFVNLGLILTILIRGGICVIVPNAIYCVAFRKTAEFKGILEIANRLTKGRFKHILNKM
jgi:O-antigen/teichoic acid export membrane protein